MSDLRKAAEQALEALDCDYDYDRPYAVTVAMNALRAALAEQRPKICETCKYWEPWKSRSFDGMGSCRMVVMWWHASEWVCDGSEFGKRAIKPGYENQKAFVQDASDYKAQLHTRKDFGCVAHEGKP
jgi:hypothetical protein